MQKSFFGYRRDNGRVGIRNHVLILPLDDLSQPACNAVANNIGGTVAILSGEREQITKAMEYLIEKNVGVEVVKDARVTH